METETDRIAAAFKKFCDLWDIDLECRASIEASYIRSAFVLGWIEGQDELIREAKSRKEPE